MPRFPSPVFLRLLPAFFACVARPVLAVPPAAPSSFEASLTKFSQTAGFPHTYAFLWNDNSSDEDGFDIEYFQVGVSTQFEPLRRVTATAETKTGTGGTGLTLPLNALSNGTTIQFRVRAFNGTPTPTEYSGPSNISTIVIPATTFTAPTGVTGTVVSESVVKAKWTDTSTSEDGVELWMIQQPGGTYSKLTDVYFYQTQEINVTGLAPGVGYQFKLRAFRLGATQTAPRTYTAFSAESAVVSPSPIAPTGLSVSNVGTTTLTLTWTDNSQTETSYEILTRPAGAGAFTVHQIAAADATTAVVVNLTPGVSLDLAVRARGDYTVTPGLSATSNVVTQLMKDVINSPHYAQVYVGQPFTYTLTTTTGSPLATRSITGLPSGLLFDGNSQITGTPDTPGATLATMSATFADGSMHSPGLSIRVLNPPVLGSAIPAQTVITGTPATVPLGGAFTDPEASSAVKVTTTLGTMNFVLFNVATPLTVANFMNYVVNGRFTDTVFDRNSPGFVVQGGSLRPAGAPNFFTNAPKFSPVVNEPGISSIRGTISMAKQPGDPNSGTNEFFVNLENNGAILDAQNGGFTVFGRVAGGGMSVADAIASKPAGTYSVVVDGTTRSVDEWPLDSPEALPFMDNTKVVGITSVVPVGVFDYAITSNTNAGAVSASVSGGNITLTPVASGTANITVRATNLDGYTLSQTFAVTTKSNVATLSKLVPGTGALSPVFSSGTMIYTATVPNTTTSITLTPTQTHSQATVQINGVPVAFGAASGAIPLQAGSNPITVLVTAEDGVTTKPYTVNVTRTPVAPVVTTLAVTAAGATGVTLNGTVNAKGASTAVSFDYGTTTGYGSSIAATPSPLAGISATAVSAVLAGLTQGTTYHFRVKGSNAAGTALGTDMTFATKSTVATLSNLVSSAGTLSPAFSSAAAAYAVTVPNSTAALTVTPTPSQSQATVQVNGAVVPSGTASGAIALTPGTNTISILVTAQDGLTSKNHTLTVTRAPAPVAITQAASSIGATSATFNGTVNAGGASTAVSFDYGLTTDYGSTATAAPSPVTGSTNTAVNATAAGLQPSTTYHYRVKGSSAGGTSLGVDATFTTTSNVATLSGLVLSTGALSPAFASATTSYTQTVPNATSSLTVTPTLGNANATVKVNDVTVASGSASGAVALSPGLNTITVVVTAQDVVTTKTYTVGVTRLAAPVVATLAQTNLTAVGAKLNGTINALNTSTAASFEYGTTLSYGSSAVATPSTATGGAVTAVSAAIAGLVPGTTYHYRIKGVSAAGTSLGDDATFATPNNVATLSGLGLSAGTLSPVFASATTLYTATVGNATASLTVTPTLSNATATVKVNGILVASGSASGAISLIVGTNTISIAGTAQDGTTTKTYTLTVTRSAALASLTTQAASGVGTTGATLNGTVNTANDTNTTMSFDYGLTTSYGSTAAGAPASVGGSAGTNVSAVLGGLMPGKTYHYRIKGVNSAGTAPGADATFATTSNVATLSGLVLSTGALSPAFASATTSYTQAVPNATSSLTVTPTLGNANATVKVNDVIVASGSASGAVALSPGLNTITVVVTAQDGVTTKTYTVGVTRLAAPVVATLAQTNLTAVGAKLNGTINALNTSTAASFEYGTTLSYGSSAVATPSPVTGSAVTAVSATIAGLVPGTTYHYRVKGVSAGGTTRGSDATFTTPGNVATLSGIGLSNGILSPVFASATTAYTATVSNVTASFTVTPVLSSANATVTVNGLTVASGSASGAINLIVGTNTISIVGTAQDGTTKKTYTLKVTRSAALASLTTQAASGVGTTGATLNGTVNTANNTSTTMSFDYGLTTSYGSTAAGAPAVVGGAAGTNVSATVAGLTPGATYHYRIKGVNLAGTTVGADKTFTMTSNVATLSGLVLSTGALTPAFAGATTSYTQTVPNATASLTVKPTATSAVATLLLNNTAINSGATSGAIALSSGLNIITVKVTAQDGVATKTYTVNVTRLDAPAVLTLAATNVTATGAKFNGALNALNSSTAVSFEYGTTLAYGSSAVATPSPVTGQTATAVSATLGTLAPGTTYHYRIKAVSAGGTNRGEDATFATPSNVATLSGLGLSIGTLSPAFASATTAYTVTVTNSTASIAVTPLLTNANATVTVNDVTVTSGSASGAIPLSPGLNLIMVRVTAQDGVVTKSYALNVTRTASPVVVTLGATNVTAVGAKINGKINALNTSTAASFAYGLNAPAYGSIAVATPSPVTGNAETAVSATLTGLLPGTTYHFQVKGLSLGVTSPGADATFTTLNNVATLSGLVLSEGTLSPVFASATTVYTATAGNATDSLTVTPTMSGGGATVKVNGLPVTPGSASGAISLNLGANTISVVGTAEDGVATKSYTITVTRTALAPTMTTLAAGAVSATSATVNGTANANNASTNVSFDYGLTTAYGSSAVATPSPLTGSTTTPVSAVLNGLLPGATYHYRVKGVNVAGTAPGTDATFTTPANAATLSGLVLSTGALSPAFASATTSYNQTVPNATTSLTVKPTATSAVATLLLNGAPITSGSTSGAIPLVSGLNAITVLVTAQDSVTTVAYTVNVTRTTPAPAVVTLQSDNVTATGATVHGTVNAQGTSTNVSFDYGLTTAYGSSTVAAESPASGGSETPVTAVLTGLLPGATYHYRVSALNAGGLSSGLDATFNTPSNVTTLSGLVLSTGALSPAFASATRDYTHTVPNATTSLTVKPTATIAAATLLINGAAITSGGTSEAIPLALGPNTITVHVTAEDGVATGDYTVDVTRTTPPPTVVTQQVDNSSISMTGATLRGTVNAEHTSTSVSFDYGLTTAYGSSAAAPESPVSGSSVTPVTAALTGLLPGRTYHYRVSGQNVGGLSKGMDATFTSIHEDVLADLTPTSTSSASATPVVLHVTKLLAGESVTIERFADANADGAVDAGEFLAEMFTVTDGQVTSIGGVRNTNMPGDEDGAADGQVSIHLSPALGPELGRLAGAQIIRVSSPTAVFPSVVRPLTITHPAQAQSITGTVTDGTNPVPHASVVLLDAANDGEFVLGVVANAAGQFTVNAPAGSYEIFAVKAGYVASFDPIALGAGSALMRDLQLAAATSSISGKVADAGTNAGLGGVQLFVQSQGGLATIASSHADGTWSVPVTAGSWQISASEVSLSHLGYVSLSEQNGVMADTTSAAVTGVNINVPKVTALIHGTVADSGANPLASILLGASDTGDNYISNAFTDADGHYVLGVTTGSWNASISNDSPGLAGYIIPNGRSVTIAGAQAVQTNFTMIAVTGQISGYVRDSNSLPIIGVRVFGSATVAGSQYSTSAITDAGGNYSLPVFAGTWKVGVSSGDLQTQGYLSPSDQSAIVSTGPATLNFIALQPTTTITGSVKNAQNNPLMGVQVFGSSTLGGTEYSTSAITNAGGNYSLPVSAGTWNVGVSSDDLQAQGHLAPSDQSAIVSTAPVTLDFIATAATTTITGSVKDAQNNPISGVQVSGSATLEGAGYSSFAVTNASGLYSLPVFPGTWNVGVSSDDLQAQGYLAPSDQSAIVSTAPVTLNFVAPQMTATIAGSVKDAQSNPISGVQVSGSAIFGGASYRNSTVTAADGNYSLPVFPGTWSMSVSSDDLQAQGCLSPSDQSAVAGTGPLNFIAPHPTATIHGTVKTPSNIPVPSVEVTARGPGLLASGLADANGNYTLGVVIGSWDVGASNTAAHVPERRNVTVNTNGSDVPQDLVVHPVTAHLRGLVRDDHDNPVGNIQIIAHDFNVINTNVFAATDASGNFDLGVYGGEGGSASKEWTMQVLLGGNPVTFVSSNPSFAVADGVNIEGITYRVYAVTAHLRGQVLDENNAPVGNIAIGASSQNVAANTGGDVTAGGLFDIPIFAGNWALGLSNIQGLGLIPQDYSILVTANVDQNNLVFRARHATATISGSLKDALDNPIGGVRMVASATVAGIVYSTSATTDATGSYSLPVFSGTWSAGVSAGGLQAQGYQAPSNQSVPVNSGSVTLNFSAGLSSNANIASLVLSAGTLSPVFATATTAYTVTVGNATASLTVTPTMSNGAANSKVNDITVTSGSMSSAINLDVGANTITVVGVAQDGVTMKTYMLTVTRSAPDPEPAMDPLASSSPPASEATTEAKANALIAWFQPAPLKARLTGPTANGGVLPGASFAFTWDAGHGVSEYWLSIGTIVGGTDLYDGSQGAGQARTVNLPTDGSDLYVTLKSKINGAWLANNYVFIAADTSSRAVLSSPADETKLSAPDATFTWNEIGGASEYWLSIGSTEGGTDVYDASQGTALSNTLSLPTDDGRELFVTLKTSLNGTWASSSSTLFASGSGAPAAARITSPANHSALSGASITFTWDAGSGVSEYWLSVGTSATAADVFSASQGGNQVATLIVPTDGSPLYITLYSLIDGKWRFDQYLYDAAVAK